jgi:hypothetical protein
VPDLTGTPWFARYNPDRHTLVAGRLRSRRFAQQPGWSTNALKSAPHS